MLLHRFFVIVSDNSNFHFSLISAILARLLIKEEPFAVLTLVEDLIQSCTVDFPYLSPHWVWNYEVMLALEGLILVYAPVCDDSDP